VSQFVANEIAANAKFEDRQLIVSGTVDKIGDDILGTPYVVLRGDESNEFNLRNVQCMFPDEAKPSLARLEIGYRISIVGTCSGLMMNVFLEDCRFVGFKDVTIQGITENERVAQRERDTKKWKSTQHSTDNISERLGPTVSAKYTDDQQKRLEQEQAAEREAEEARLKAEEDAKYRIWTSTNGKKSPEAKILSYSNGVVTIETRAGKKAKVPLDKLSDADKEYIAKWRKER
jgi:hypothetical protein